MQKYYKKIIFFLVAIILLSACAPAQNTVVIRTDTPAPLPVTAAATATQKPTYLWIGNSVPDVLRDEALAGGLPLATKADDAILKLELKEFLDEINWVYALVAPFPTIKDGVSTKGLKAAWDGNAPEPWDESPLWMAESTKAALTALWGEASPKHVRIADADELLDLAWAEKDSWAIIPFEEIEQRWKVL